MSSIPSISASVMSPRLNPVSTGIYEASTVNGDIFQLDFDNHRVVKNPQADYTPTDLELQLQAGKISRKAFLRSLEAMRIWTTGFMFTSVCEVGRPAALMLGSDEVSILTVFLTEEIANIQRIS
jgi:hypothetical protein